MIRKEYNQLVRLAPVVARKKIRFLAYGQQQSFSNGWAFMILVVLWLRSF